MINSKKAAFAFVVSTAILNGKCALVNNVHAADLTPNMESSAYTSQNIFTKYGYKGQCTWFTYGRVLEKLNLALPSEFYGNAVDWWYANAKDNTYGYGSEPKANSIIVWGGGRVGYGHVGFVEKVEGNTVYFNEGNFNVRGSYDGKVKAVSKEEIKNRGNLYLKGYIYLDGSKSNANNQSNNTTKPSTPSNNSNGSKEPVIKTGTISLESSNSALNVRKSTSTSSGVIGCLSNGNKVNIVGVSGDWYKIEFNSSYAYVNSKYVKSGSSSNSSTNTNSSIASKPNDSTSSQTGVVTLSDKGSSLNLRNSPSGGVISSLSNGTKVSILSSNNGWYKINVNGTTGYVSASYVNTSSSKTTASTNSSAVSTNSSVASTNTDNSSVKGKVGLVTLSDKSSTLNLRNSPWTGRILSTLTCGSKVEILNSSGRWLKVQANGAIGFVHSDYIKL